MIDFNLLEISKIIGGKLIVSNQISNNTIKQIVTDSRTFFNGKNSIFFALVGPRNNGHNYISDLIEKGISAFVISDSSQIKEYADYILVENTTVALQKLAAFNRRQINYPVIGITGSNGKTIIKEWLYDLLSDEFKIVRSPKSYNSQIGVPLSVLLMNTDFDLGIIEAGISQSNEMERLAEIIAPEIGILTNIGDAHQENFESVQQKLNEKLLLFKNSRKLVYCSDHTNLKTEVSEFCALNSIEKINWTLNNSEALISFSAKKKIDLTEIRVSIQNQKFFFSIPFTNNSAIENACHCFAAAWALNINLTKVLHKFKTLGPVAMRLEIKQGINKCLLINDYYNSDLNSLSIALSVLHQQAAKDHLHKQVILSDMHQTGIPANVLYKKVNELLEQWKIDFVIGIGPDISTNANKFSIKKRFYKNRADFERKFARNDFNSSVILLKGARQFTFEKISSLLQQKAHQTVLEINLNALVNNLNFFRGLLKPETKIMAMVKAFSYGSGDIEIAKLLQYQNIDYLAVAVADEGVQLRNAGISTPIIVMNPELHSFQNMIDYQLEPNIYSIELLKDFLTVISENALQQFPVHLKIDTGMNRLGLKSSEEIQNTIELIVKNNLVKIKSVFSHLAASDEMTMDDFTLSQFDIFEQWIALISNTIPYKFDCHILNSAGIERFAHKQYEMVRLGIGLYGVSNTGLPLQNIGTLKSTISQVKSVSENETVGYNRKGKVSGETKVAIVPLGYADGLDRKLGNKNGCAFLNGERVSIIGNVCMDMLMLDVTNIETKPGDEVEFFGPNITISELAEKAGTIPYEILTGISQRVKRVYLHE